MSGFGRRLLFGAEILILSALILTTRCANYQDVFVGNHIYFTDADCYARMTRVRLCAQRPGLVLRHHTFENYPQGTTPHTTAPLDYAILFLSFLLRPFASRPIDLAGAFISPLFAILGGAFLCWWGRRMAFPFRWAMLVLFGISPIIVHGTELGRPDHQSLVLLLVMVAICADAVWRGEQSARWGVVSGLGWGFAIWVSAYEPLVLFLLSSAAAMVARSPGAQGPAETKAHGSMKLSSSLTTSTQRQFGAPHARARWIAFAAVIVCGLLIERRVPSFSGVVNDPIFQNWSRTIGELSPISLLNPIWFRWVGWLIAAIPLLVFAVNRIDRSAGMIRVASILLVATFGLTMWQARWGYFFAVLFVIVIPGMLASIRSRPIAWILFGCSLWPILRDWDERIWPDEIVAARQSEQRHEAVELRELSINLISGERRPFLAPWWLSPAITYWSGQPAVTGSSHESLPGIADSAAFFLSEEPAAAAEILRRRQVASVVVYDAERVEKTSAMILGKASSNRGLARLLDQRPAYAPPFLTLSVQNGTGKIFKVANKW